MVKGEPKEKRQHHRPRTIVKTAMSIKAGEKKEAPKKREMELDWHSLWISARTASLA